MHPGLKKAIDSASARIESRLDRNGDGKIDAADARAIASDAAHDAAAFTRDNPLTGIVIAFAAGIVLTLFVLSIFR